jgi:geranyl-CoA carboxylase beta subunit
MPLFNSQVDVHSTAFAENYQGHLAKINAFRELEQKIETNSARSLPKFRKRGQLLPRERINLLLDRGSPFLGISTLCGNNMNDDDGDRSISGGGVIGGIGFVSGVRCMIAVNDSGIRGGAMTPMGVQKVLRMQTIAMENKLPYVQLIESAGANLYRQSELFIDGGRTFANQARLSALGLPVVGVTHGSSTAGGAYQSGLCDYIVVVRGRTKIFLAGPPLLKAATGEIATDEELGGAEMHHHVTGIGEYMAEGDADGIRICREIVDKLGWNTGQIKVDTPSYKEPVYDPDELLGCVPLHYQTPFDSREVIARIVDGSDLLEFKPGYGPHTVTTHASIEGYPVGIISNNGPIDTQGATKAAQFIQLCCQSDTPILFLQNTTGFMVGTDAERGGIVKHGSKMVQAVTNATVPKLTLHIGSSFGAGNYGMCGRGYDPEFIFAWPNNRVSVMGGVQAAKTMSTVVEATAKKAGKEPDYDALEKMEQQIIEQYDKEGEALYATARLWDDGIIDPRDSRKVLAFCLATCREGRERVVHPNTFGVGRM